MANMSYCRFQNTLSDLEACYDCGLDIDECTCDDEKVGEND